MFESVYGLTTDGNPKTIDEVITDIVEEEVKSYIDVHLRIEEAGGMDPKVIFQLRQGTLAEPWLPAVKAMYRIMSALSMADGAQS